MVQASRNGTEALSSAALSSRVRSIRPCATIKVPALACLSASTQTAKHVSSRAIAIACGTASSPSERASRPFRLPVRPRQLVGAPLLGTKPTRRPACQITPCRVASTEKGSAIRISLRQARRAATIPIGTRHEASKPATTLQGEAQDGPSSAGGRVGRTVVANAEDASGVVKTRIAAFPDLDVPAVLALPYLGLRPTCPTSVASSVTGSAAFSGRRTASRTTVARVAFAFTLGASALTAAAPLVSLPPYSLRLRSSMIHRSGRGRPSGTDAIPTVALTKTAKTIGSGPFTDRLIGSLTSPSITALSSAVRTTVLNLIIKGPSRRLVLWTALSIPKSISKGSYHPPRPLRASS